MCLLCTADEMPDPLEHCPQCGCPIVLYDGAYFCTPEECWCAQQPDAGDWHALAQPEGEAVAMTWVDPKHVENLVRVGPITTDGTCTNCQGTGRHIYVDTDGQMKDIPCSACTGGQTPDPQ